MTNELAPTANGHATDLVLVESLAEHFARLYEAGETPIDPAAGEIALDNFARLKEGENRFRLLDKPVYGAEVWFRRVVVDEETGEALTNDDGTPRMESRVKRYRPSEPIFVPSELTSWQKDKARKFVGMLVYNYGSGNIEVLAVSNSKLFDQLWKVLRDSDGNNPFRADLKIHKAKDGPTRKIGGRPMDVFTHQVTLTKENQPPVELLTALQRLPFRPDLSALFAGEDPFAMHAAEVIDAPAPAEETPATNGQPTTSKAAKK